MKYIFALAVFISIAYAVGRVVANYPVEVDEGTQKNCREYADRDHEKEFAPERYAQMKDMIINYDWYTSCIRHTMCPVAGGRGCK